MPNVALFKNKFNAGEFSPLAQARVDLDKYANGVARLLNFIPQVQGGLTRRSGSKYISATISNKKARLIPFIFSNGDTFVLEFTAHQIRFYKNRVLVTSSLYPYVISTSYSETELDDIRVLGLNDVVYIAHANHKPRLLVRESDTSWSLHDAYFKDGPYMAPNKSSTTLTPGAITVGATTSLTANEPVFRRTDVGRLIRLRSNNVWGSVVIHSYTSTVSVGVEVITALGDVSATLTWRWGLWSDTTGYPSVVYFFEGRLGWGGAGGAPLDLTMSVTDDFQSMAPSEPDGAVRNDSALHLTLNAGRQDPIRWVTVDEKGLVAGTEGGEWVLLNTASAALSAENLPQAKESSTYGSAAVQPLRIGKSTVFVQRARRKLRELSYVFQYDGFHAPDMTVLAEHATDGQVKQMAYQQEPYSLIWLVMDNGELWGVTYEQEQEVIAFHQHEIGGSGLVESIASIPSPEGSSDDVYIVVKREINGTERRYVEYLSECKIQSENAENKCFLDGSVSITLTSAGTSVTGLGHLEGMEVAVLVDGSPQTNKRVNVGAITLDTAGTVVQVGLPYKSRVKTLQPEAGAANGTAQGKSKRIHEVSVRLYETVGLSYGNSFERMDDLTFREPDDAMDQAVPLFTGEKRLQFDDNWGYEGQICLEQSQPLPCTILGIAYQMDVQDNR